MVEFSISFKKLILISVIFLSGCSPRVIRNGYEVSKDTKNDDCEVIIKQQADFNSNNVEMIGRLKIRDTGFSRNCEESDVLKILRREACAVGADIINIIDEKRADILSTCYRVDAELLKSKDSQYTQSLQTDDEYQTRNLDSRVRRDKKRKTGMFAVGFLIAFSFGFIISRSQM